jgi:hypothetical protein
VVGDQEHSVIVDAWRVRESRYETQAVEGLFALLDLLVDDEGFVEAQVFAAPDGTLVCYGVMRSVAERQRVEERPDVRKVLRSLHAIAHSQRHTLKTLRVVRPDPDHGDR